MPTAWTSAEAKWHEFCLGKMLANILPAQKTKDGWDTRRTPKKKQLYLSTFAPTLRNHLSGFSLPSKTLSPAKDYQFHFKLLWWRCHRPRVLPANYASSWPKKGSWKRSQKQKGAYINLVFSFSRFPLIFISGPASGLWSILDFIFAAFGFLLFSRVLFHFPTFPSRKPTHLIAYLYLPFFPHFRLILSACKQLVCFHFASLLLQFYWLDFKSIGGFILP